MYLLRWRMDYTDKSWKCGGWNLATQDPACAAWAHNSDKVTRVAIEGLDPRTNAVTTLAECDGHDFRNFMWRVERGLFTGVRAVVGAMLLTTDKVLFVSTQGDRIDRDLTDSERGTEFATFGK